MTSAAAPFPGKGESGLNRAATRLAHYTPIMWLVGGLGMAATAYLTKAWPFWQYVIVVLPSTFIVVSAVSIGAWHDYALCAICARKIPLDPDAKVAQKRGRLKSLHWLDDHRRLNKGAQLALMILIFVPYVSRVAFPVFAIYTAVLEYLMNTHRPLQPWCPWCKGGWGEGGAEERTPTPDPTAARTA